MEFSDLPSGVTVAYQPAESQRDVSEIERQLRNVSPELFLAKEFEPFGPRGGYFYWAVRHWLGDATPAPVCLEWRDQNGPWPLSYALVERVARKEGAGAGAVEWAVRHNQAKKEQARAESEAAYDDVINDFHRAGTKGAGHFSGPVKRSVKLRMARDKARGRGEKA